MCVCVGGGGDWDKLGIVAAVSRIEGEGVLGGTKRRKGRIVNLSGDLTPPYLDTRLKGRKVRSRS